MTSTGAGGAVARSGELADHVAEAVLAVDGVTDLHGGLFGEIGTYLPGRRVRGVRLGPAGSAQVHVVLRWGVDIPRTAGAIRRAVAALVDGPVEVTVEDLATGPTAGGTRGSGS
ncbi:hypothetical protein [Jiangella gansuensis]|uniref:hypothetical protein n=1 Tax=Jiangella gansuensis TaxID=281473 RepID=UPI00047B4E3B|nr:hypothetical protein [Jiangella gansuensis]